MSVFSPLRSRTTTRKRPAPYRGGFRPCLERLEDRTVPTAGFLDPTFGSDPVWPGRAVTDLGGNEAAQSVALQPDGKIVVAGSITTERGVIRLALLRYNPDGSLDDGGPNDSTPGDSFGSGGKVFTDTDFRAQDVVLQPDGRIVIAGSFNSAGSGGFVLNFALLRYNPDGRLDDGGPSDSTPGDRFGSGGMVVTDFGRPPANRDIAEDLVLQPDGKIVAAGISDRPGGSADFVLVRYHPDGNLDSAFGVDGRVVTVFAGLGFATSVVLQADGKIVVAGFGGPGFGGGGPLSGLLARYKPDGSLDSGFGADGKVVADVGVINDAVLQFDGKIVVAGFGPGDFALARFAPDGSLDSGFGIGGKVITDFGGDDGARSVFLQPDGKIVAAGYTGREGFGLRFALARYSTNGSLDTSFNLDGKVVTDFDGSAADDPRNISANLLGTALQFDGKIVVAGGIDGNIALARYKGDLTMTVSPSLSVTSYGQAVTFTATVSMGAVRVTTGTVTFSEGSTILASGIALDGNGRASFTTTRLSASGSPHTITASFSSTAPDDVSSATTSLIVNKTSLAVTVNDQTKIFGEVNPAFTVSYSGFVLGEGPAVLGGILNFSTTATTVSPPGTYAVTAEGLTSGNYAITFVNGTLTVLGYGEATSNLIARVTSAGLPKGLETSLAQKLQAAAELFNHGRTTPGKSLLGAFQNAVTAHRGGAIADDLADALIADAQRIIDAIA